MSPIDTLKNDFSNLPDILAEYEIHLSAIMNFLSLEGKTLEEANRSQAYDMMMYASKCSELKALVKILDQNVERIKSKLWRQYTEVVSIDLSTRDKDQYIKSESAFLNANTLLITVEEIHSKYEMAVEAFRQRGFALRNITNARVSSIQDAVI